MAELGLGILGVALFVMGFCIFWLISSTLNGIIIAGVYQYGVTGKLPDGFSQEQVNTVFHS